MFVGTRNKLIKCTTLLGAFSWDLIFVQDPHLASSKYFSPPTPKFPPNRSKVPVIQITRWPGHSKSVPLGAIQKVCVVWWKLLWCPNILGQCGLKVHVPNFACPLWILKMLVVIVLWRSEYFESHYNKQDNIADPNYFSHCPVCVEDNYK